tara:strand:+ start:182 stop:484 length:303 start_codon:yes stop_codon:yes gene_type:complete
MSPDIDKLTINTSDERGQWKQLLKSASEYHYDMSDQFEPEDLDDDPDDMATVAKIHRAWARAIMDSVNLIEMWEVEEDIISVDMTPPPQPINVTPEEEEE